MTTSSSTRRQRRADRQARGESPARRGDLLVDIAATLVGFAAGDSTVSGATIFLPDGTCRHMSVNEAAAIAGIAEPAGSA